MFSKGDREVSSNVLAGVQSGLDGILIILRNVGITTEQFL